MLNFNAEITSLLILKLIFMFIYGTEGTKRGLVNSCK